MGTIWNGTPTNFYDALSFHLSGNMCMTSTDEDGFKTEKRIDIAPMPLNEELSLVLIDDGSNISATYTSNDITYTLEAKDHFIILPNVDFFDYNLNSYISKKSKIKYKKLKKRFSYNSQENKNFLSINQLKNIISKTIKK